MLLTEYYSGDQINKNEMGGSCSTYGERRGAHRFLVAQPDRKRQCGRSRRRCEDNIKMDLTDGGWGGTDWIDRAKYRDRWRGFVIAVMNLWVPLNTGNFFVSSGNVYLLGKDSAVWS